VTEVSASASPAPSKAASAPPALAPGAPTTRTAERRRYDRSILEGPLRPAVWKIAWPTMLTNIIGGMQGIVDHVLVGHLVGYKGNAAIGVAWQIFLIVIAFISSLFIGMGVLVARFAGAGEEDQVEAEALPFLRIMFLCSIGMMVFFMLGGALRSAGDARTPMTLGIALTVLNLVLNIVFIRGLGPVPALGTKGAAVGTCVASGILMFYALYKLWSGTWVVKFPRGQGYSPDWAIIRSLFRFGLPSGIQGIAMNVGGTLMLAFIGSVARGPAAQAAFAIGYSQLFSLITWTSVGLMGAAAAVAGQNLGARQPERADAAVHVAARFGVLGAAFIGAFFLFLPRQLLGVFGMDDPAVLEIGTQLLRVLSVSGLFITIALTYTGGLQGTGDTKGPLYISIISQIMVPLGICFVIQQTGTLQPIHIWIAILVGHATRCVLSVLRFNQGKWRNIAVDLR
jgi:putative MATE family efflux protein